MENSWEFSDLGVWSYILLFAVLLGSLLLGNLLKKKIPLLQQSLIPTSVLGGAILLLVAAIYKWITGNVMFDAPIFGSNGTATLEIITYHSLALGFIASAFTTNDGKLSKKRSAEVFNTGVTTVSTYLLQGIFGLGITLIATFFLKDLLAAAGVLLPFGYGQGSGQALNYGKQYAEAAKEMGLSFDGASFGLTIAALGFLSAAFGGVVHLQIMKRRGKLKLSERRDGSLHTDKVDSMTEVPMQESIDKMTIQIALILVAYAIAFGLMYLLSHFLPGMSSLIFGFNFLLGVLVATVIKITMNWLRKKRIMRKKYTNNFLMTRAGNFFFDLMIVAGVAAIRLDILDSYWGVIAILAVTGIIITYVYNRIVAKTLFPDYTEEQFLAMYGMLTGTASTGIILLREVDKEFRTPASDNLVYQNFPAIVFGFPMMFLAKLAITKPVLTLIIFVVFFVILNVILFRSKIFKKKSSND